MNLYLLEQDENTDYETYDSCVVAAESSADAAMINPGGQRFWGEGKRRGNVWCSTPDKVIVTLIGVAAEGIEAGRIICASYNAG